MDSIHCATARSACRSILTSIIVKVKLNKMKGVVMKIAAKVVTPIGIVFCDPGDGTEEDLELATKLLKNGVEYFEGMVAGNKVIFPGELMNKSYVVLVKDPEWTEGFETSLN
jgi:hypothetical protein